MLFQMNNQVEIKIYGRVKDVNEREREKEREFE